MVSTELYVDNVGIQPSTPHKCKKFKYEQLLVYNMKVSTKHSVSFVLLSSLERGGNQRQIDILYIASSSVPSKTRQCDKIRNYCQCAKLARG